MMQKWFDTDSYTWATHQLTSLHVLTTKDLSARWLNCLTHTYIGKLVNTEYLCECYNFYGSYSNEEVVASFSYSTTEINPSCFKAT